MRARILAAAAAALCVVPTYAFSQRIRIPEIRVPEIKPPEIKEKPDIQDPPASHFHGHHHPHIDICDDNSDDCEE
jgi:hypothetical protein